MVPPLDIFRVTPDGQLLWKTTAESLESAHRRVRILMTSEPGEYVIYSQETGHKTIVRMQEQA